MIHSTVGGNDSSWMDPIQSQKAVPKSFDYGFSQLSISSFGSNRPPALSVSSISSIGEDQNPCASSNNSGANEIHYNYLSVSPVLGNNVSSPKITTHNSNDSRHTNTSCQANLNPLVFNRVRSRSQPNGYGVFTSSQSTSEHTWRPRQHVQEKHNIHPTSSDLSDDRGLGTWSQNNDNVIITTVQRSAHSLQNMHSVDENEEFLGNRGRARTLSAGNGFHGYKNNYGAGFNSTTFNTLDSSSNNLFLESSGQGNPTNQLFQSPNNGQKHISNVSSFDPRESIHSKIRENDVSSPIINQRYHNRQRVMSADAIFYSRFASSSRIGHEQINHASPLMSDNYVDVHNTSVDPQINFFPQMNPNSDNRFSTMPQIHLNGMSEQEYLMRMNISRHVSDPSTYYQSHGVIAGIPARVIYTVKFKRSQRNFVLGPHILGDIKIGTYVKVEADRGEDLGVVLSRVPAEKFNLSSRLSRHGNSDSPITNSGIPEMKKILSVASSEEIALLRIKQEEEDELLKICRSKTEQRGLPMHVVDAEYQFDRHKLTFFFEAEGRIDFRELVRELFSIYKTRIWMQQIDKNSTGSSGNNIIAATSFAACEKIDKIHSEK